MATLTLSKPSSKYSIGVKYCHQVENNSRCALIALYCEDIGKTSSTVGSHLKYASHRQSASHPVKYLSAPVGFPVLIGANQAPSNRMVSVLHH